MIKAILGIVGLLVGLGVAIYFLYPGKPVKTPAAKPPEQTQVAVHPTPEADQKPAATTPQPSTVPEPTPPAAGPAAPPAVVPVPTPETPPVEKPAEKQVAPSPTLQPKKEHGLVVGKFRRYKDAQRRLDKIKKKNLPGFIRKDGKYYKVWAGPFATPQEAEKARKSLKTAYKISPQKRDYEEPVPK
jgi:cell division protein FtsN